ncbi:MAG: hypothetical protein ACO3EE_04265 [Flavobacteriales bacterium]
MKFAAIRLVYDNALKQENVVSFNFNNDTVVVNFNDIINTHWQQGNVDENEKNYLKEFLKIGMSSRAICGGFANFYRIKTQKGEEVLLYSGVSEPSNSHFVVTIHGIFL